MDRIVYNGEFIAVTPIKIDDDLNNSVKEGDLVNIQGVMKGRGFQGVVKRHGFAGGPKSHGQKDRLRAPGSIGATAPQRVFPGRKMAGHMGTTKVTIRNLKVVQVDYKNKKILVKGAVPGNTGGTVRVTLRS